MQVIKALETENNTYYVGLGYGVIAKTSYEQQQEKRSRFIRLLIQKVSAILLIVICTAVSFYTKDAMCMIVGTLIGSLMLFCNNLFD